MSEKSLVRHPGMMDWVGLCLCTALLVWYYAFYVGYTSGTQTAVAWVQCAWNRENDYEHGWMVPLLAGYLVVHAWRRAGEGELRRGPGGLWLLALGGALALLAARTQQGRVAIGALPVLLTGLVWCYAGPRAARTCAFPFFFLWLAIPLPGFQQATVGLQLLATKGAQWGAALFGVQTVVEGTNISSASGQWDTYSIVGGCSGIRSLMALLMLSAAWGYLADGLALWKRVLLGLSAVPLSILANAFRVASIFVCAEYVDASFAGKTWHDWSGLLFFFPASLVGLTVLHGLLAGEIPFLKKRRVVVRTNRDEA